MGEGALSIKEEPEEKHRTRNFRMNSGKITSSVI
jgi:hypothetical protein